MGQALLDKLTPYVRDGKYHPYQILADFLWYYQSWPPSKANWNDSFADQSRRRKKQPNQLLLNTSDSLLAKLRKENEIIQPFG